MSAVYKSLKNTLKNFGQVLLGAVVVGVVMTAIVLSIAFYGAPGFLALVGIVAFFVCWYLDYKRITRIYPGD